MGGFDNQQKQSEVSHERGLVVQSQEPEDVLLGVALRNWFVPDDSLLHLGNCTLIGQLEAELHRVQSQHSIKCAVAREVEDGEGILLNGVVLDVDSMVGRALVLADAHVGHRGTGLAWPRMREMVSQKPEVLEFLHEINEEGLLVDPVLPGDDDVHVPALGAAPAVGAADLNAVHIQGDDQSFDDIPHEIEHLGHLLSRDLALEVLEVLQPDLLVAVEQVGALGEVLEGLDAHGVELVGLAWTDAPDLAQHSPCDVLLRGLEGFQFVDLPSIQQFLDLLGDLVPDSSEILNVLLGLDFTIESANDRGSFHVGHLPAQVPLSCVDLHEFGELIGDELVHGEVVLLLLLVQDQLLDVHLLAVRVV